MEKINIGIIGVGAVGERFIKALQRHSRANILGINDTNIERLELISNTYKVPIVDTYEELLSNKEIDAIYLAVPPKYHYSIALDIIKAKKHFICEKPLANSVNEAKEMYEEAEKHNIIHAMNFPVVYTTGFKKLKTLLDEGFIGDLRRIELHTYFEQWPRYWQKNNWIDTREQGGFIREVFTHYIQMIQMVFGKIVDINTKVEYPKDDLACEKGIMATAALSEGTPILLSGLSDIGIEENISLSIYGTEGTISLVNWRDLWTASKGDKNIKMDLPERDHLHDLIDEFFNAIEGKNAKIISFREGYDAQIVIEKLLGKEI